MESLVRLGLRARRGFGRVVPDPFVIAIGLTALTMTSSLALGHSPIAMLESWNRPQGLWGLLAFAMQMCLMLMLGSALAAAPVVHRALSRVAGAARGPRQLVGLVALVAMALSVLNWSLGLIGGALLARDAGRVAARRGWRLHYPLLCAAGYSGLMAWHGGLSGSAPLKTTTTKDVTDVLGPELAARMEPIPLEASLFSALNLWVTGGLLVLGPLLFWALCPRADPEADPPPASVLKDPAPAADENPGSLDAIERVERSSLVGWALAVPLAVALAAYLARHGVGRLDLNTVNLSLFALALMAHGRPDRFLAACENGVRGCTGVILQFPLYAGIMGILTGSGLSSLLADGYAGVGPQLFPLSAFLSAGALNVLVPSGGGQWAVQGPILIEAALELGVPARHALMALCYGDQWTNMIQPFWALPLLAITGVRARDIVGYCVIWMAVGGLWMVANLLVQL